MNENQQVDLSRYYLVDKDTIRTIYFNLLIQGGIDYHNSLSVKGVRYVIDNEFDLEELLPERENPVVPTTKGEVLLKTIETGNFQWWIYSIKKSKEVATKSPYVLNVVCSGYVCIDYPEDPLRLQKENISADDYTRISIQEFQDVVIVKNESKTRSNTVALKIGKEKSFILAILPEEEMKIPKGTCFYLHRFKKYGCVE